MKKRQNHIKARSKNILCSESNGSQVWLPLQVKFETKAQILAKRPEGATGDLTNKKYFCFLLLLCLSKWLSMQIFIKIWYTENNIVKN